MCYVLVAWTSFMPLDRFAARLKKRPEKKLSDWKKIVLHLCKLETCTYISLAAMYGLTAIDNILVAGWKHASFLSYSMGVRWFLRFLGPKLELPRSSAYSPYLRCLWVRVTKTRINQKKCSFDTLLPWYFLRRNDSKRERTACTLPVTPSTYCR